MEAPLDGIGGMKSARGPTIDWDYGMINFIISKRWVATVGKSENW